MFFKFIRLAPRPVGIRLYHIISKKRQQYHDDRDLNNSYYIIGSKMHFFVKKYQTFCNSQLSKLKQEAKFV